MCVLRLAESRVTSEVTTCPAVFYVLFFAERSLPTPSYLARAYAQTHNTHADRHSIRNVPHPDAHSLSLSLSDPFCFHLSPVYMEIERRSSTVFKVTQRLRAPPSKPKSVLLHSGVTDALD